MLVHDVERRTPAVPHGPVEVVGILAVAAVEGYQPGAVHPVGPAVGTVVEHVVDPHAPEERIALQVTGILLVEVRLSVLGHPVRPRLGLRRIALVADESAASVADARAQVGPAAAQLVAPHGHIVRRTPVPPDRLLPDNQIRHEIDLAVLITQRHRRPRGIHRVGRIVQPPDIGSHVVAAGTQAREESPHEHRGMVDVLRHDLAQLLDAVFLEERRGEIGHIAQERGAVERDVDPDQHALLVATVVEVLRVGHDSRPQGIGPHIADPRQIGIVVLGREAAADNGVVVVERHTPDRGQYPVQPQPAAGSGRHRTETGADDHPVGDAVLADRGSHGIERRRIGAPQRRILD